MIESLYTFVFWGRYHPYTIVALWGFTWVYKFYNGIQTTHVVSKTNIYFNALTNASGIIKMSNFIAPNSIRKNDFGPILL